MKNATVRDGDSNYNRRHKRGHIDEKRLLPFGCFVHFIPSPVLRRRLPRKVNPPTVPGILVGYKTLSGGLWDRVYECIALDDFAGSDCHAQI